MHTTQQLIIPDLDWEIDKASQLAEMGKPFDLRALQMLSLRWSFHLAEACLGWIWRQWLKGVSHEVIRSQVCPFVERGLRMRHESRDYEKLPHHDLLLLHCALLGSDWQQVGMVAEAIADSAGDKGEKPFDVGGLYAAAVGEQYAAAWCGVLKHTILGNEVKARQEYDLVWKSRRDLEFTAAPKAMAAAWLKKDWKSFVNQQRKDFDRLWVKARKNAWSVKSQSPTQIVVTTRGYRIGHMWCWSHCGLALLAARQGIEVATDSFWFPTHALANREVKL